MRQHNRVWIPLLLTWALGACSVSTTESPDSATDTQTSDATDATNDALFTDASLTDDVVNSDATIDSATPLDAADDHASLPDTQPIDVLNDVSTPDVINVIDVPNDVSTPDVITMPDGGSEMCSLRLQRPTPLATLERVSDLAQGSNRITTSPCAPAAGPVGGAEAIYQLNVPTTMSLELTTMGPNTAATDTVLSIRRACNDATSEVACNDDISGTNFASRIRTTLTAGTYYVIVDRYGPATSFDFDLSVSPFTPQPGMDCTSPISLSAGVVQPGMLLPTNMSRAACRPTESGPQTFYSFTIPANSTATFAVAPSGVPFAPTVRVFDSCSSTVCLASAGGGNGTGETLRYDNPTNTPRTVLVSVGAGASITTASYNILVSVVALATGGSCNDAIALTPGVRTNTSFLVPSSGGTPCGTLQLTDAMRYLSLTIPPMKSALVTLSRAGGFVSETTLEIINSCTAGQCLTRMVRNVGTSVSVMTTNTSNLPKTVIVLVAGPTSSGIVSIDTTLSDAAPNASCSTPTTLIPDVPLNNIAATGGGDSLGQVCDALYSGGSHYYRVTVPPLQRVTISQSGPTTFTPLFRLLNACTPTQCLSSGSNGLSWTNTTAFPRDLLFAVSWGTPTTTGTYGVLATLSGTYTSTVSQFAASCDTVSTASIVPLFSLNGMVDDTATPITPIPAGATPLNFRYYGSLVSHFSIASNGFVQLWNNTTGTPSTSWTNTSLPDTNEPNRMIAAFWDDLNTPQSTNADVRAEVFGTVGTRRFVVQWTGWTIVGATTARITMQAKMFESSNVIELHYCQINATGADIPRSGGSEATIGVENATGDIATQVLPSATPPQLATGTLIRLTPN